jgi:hypothetical protein
MFLNLRKVLLVGLVMVGVCLAPGFSRADSSGGHYGNDGYHPTGDGGRLGLGVEFGDPGTWGVSGKLWVDRVNAFQPAVKFTSGNVAILQFDYLWHNFDIIHMDETSGEMPLYIGFGGNLALLSVVDVAGRIPIGMSYIFDKRNVPVDIYLQVVPTLWFFSGGFSRFDCYGELGGHFYF